MKRKFDDLSEKEYMHTIDLLYTAASQVKGRDATKLFLHDLLTQSERIMLGRRIWIARLIISGTPQREIQRKLKVGPNTIAKVRKWIDDQFPGYEKAIETMEEEFNSRRRKRDPELGTLAYMKKKYPLHFLLFPEPKKKRSSK